VVAAAVAVVTVAARDEANLQMALQVGQAVPGAPAGTVAVSWYSMVHLSMPVLQQLRQQEAHRALRV
jgi:hypothetical protein